jgi:hypothetical protein
MFFNYTVFRYPPLQRESERNSPHSTPNDSRLVLITIRAAKNSAFHIRSSRTFRAACDNQKLTHNSESGESSAPRYVFTRIYRLPLKLACTGYKIAHELFFFRSLISLHFLRSDHVLISLIRKLACIFYCPVRTDAADLSF